MITTGELRRSARPIFLWAVVLSILAHLLFGIFFPGFFRNRFREDQSPPEVLRISSIVRLHHIIPKTKTVTVHMPKIVAPVTHSRATVQHRPRVAAVYHPRVALNVPHSIARPVRAPAQKAFNPARDEALFAKTIAQAREADNPLRGTQGSGVEAPKHYSALFGTGGGGPHGYIKPTRAWTDGGYHYYYVHIDVYWEDGTQESDDVPWPIRYLPQDDPFPRDQHEIPLPGPLPDYVLPPNTILPRALKPYFP